MKKHASIRRLGYDRVGGLRQLALVLKGSGKNCGKNLRSNSNDGGKGGTTGSQIWGSYREKKEKTNKESHKGERCYLANSCFSSDSGSSGVRKLGGMQLRMGGKGKCEMS